MTRKSNSNKNDIAIIGPGTLGSSLAKAFHRAGCRLSEIIAREDRQSLRRAETIARTLKSSSTTADTAEFSARVIWICVPDDSISQLAAQIADGREWSGKIVLHSSGALASSVLSAFKDRGAEIASAHPLMTFVAASEPNFAGVPFALEGDPKALAVVAALVRSIGGKPFRIPAAAKAAYHAFGFFSSPAIAALMAAAQQVGALAGLDPRRSRELMEPIVRQTIDNCFRTTPQEAFSGPLRRGDVATIRKHLEVLAANPELLELYRALARIALRELPVSNREALERVIGNVTTHADKH